MSLAEQLRDAIAAYREALESGDLDAIRRARAEHIRIAGEIQAEKPAAARGGRR